MPEDTSWWERELNSRHVATTRIPENHDPHRPVVFDLTGAMPEIALKGHNSDLWLLADYAQFRVELAADDLDDLARMFDQSHRARTRTPGSTVLLTRLPGGTWRPRHCTPASHTPLETGDHTTLAAALDQIETDERDSPERWRAYHALGIDQIGAVLDGRV